MKTVKYSKPVRIDESFLKILKKIPFDRYNNGLEEDHISLREVTRMATNADSFQALLNELKTKPRKKIVW